MKFDKILEYQKVDMEYQALESELAKSDARKKYVYAKAALDNASEMGGKVLQEATDLLKNYKDIEEKISALKAELDSFDGILDGVQDATEADYYIKAISSIQTRIVALEKEANACAQKIDQIGANYKKTWEQGAKLTEASKLAKREFDELVAQKQPIANGLMAKLAAIKGEIPANFLNAYLALRSAKKMPAFVEYDPQKASCGRCFMELPNDAKAKLRNPGDYAECPNCRRVLFIPEQQ